jgi:hypothetical protein
VKEGRKEGGKEGGKKEGGRIPTKKLLHILGWGWGPGMENGAWGLTGKRLKVYQSLCNIDYIYTHIYMYMYIHTYIHLYESFEIV